MNTSRFNSLSRRRFIGECCKAVGVTGMLSSMAQMRLIGAVAAPTDFKALVCLFLSGGNDANNLIVPYDTSGYSSYAIGRGQLALPQNGLLPISPATSDGREWALHPSVAGLRDLFNSGDLALLANVGTLVVPTTKTQFEAQSVPLPPQLFSHNDQSVQWQSSVPDQPFSTGWGGRLADLTNAFNEDNEISMSISLAGQNSFQVGSVISPYTVSSEGPESMSAMDGVEGAVRRQALTNLLSPQDANLLQAAFGTATGKAIANSDLLSGILGDTPPFTTVFPDSDLGQQLRMIAWLINVAPQLGLNRQVFFANLWGWDLHDSQVDLNNTTSGAHAELLGDLSASLSAFQAAMVELGHQDQVTTFTASDFGRTYNTNGDGSDHGWGNHHIIMGGAVQGGDIYGTFPDLTVDGPDDTGRGRWIPTTSVDEYSATLARWFGVSESNLSLVLPNIGRFANPNLGFMV